MLSQIIIIVFRESFEAVLILSLIYSILVKQQAKAREMWFFRGGVAGGILLTILAGYTLLKIQDQMEGQSLENFQNALLLIGALLMTHMCLWMKDHSKNLKDEYSQKIKGSLEQHELWTLALISVFAILREGIETVLFLAGFMSDPENAVMITQGALIGFSIALACFFILKAGFKWIKTSYLFTVTTAFLFLTASGFIAMAIRSAIQSETIPSLRDAIWDTSFILEDFSTLGSFFSKWFGYQSQPSLMLVLALGSYWAITIYLYFRKTKSISAEAKP